MAFLGDSLPDSLLRNNSNKEPDLTKAPDGGFAPRQTHNPAAIRQLQAQGRFRTGGQDRIPGAVEVGDLPKALRRLAQTRTEDQDQRGGLLAGGLQGQPGAQRGLAGLSTTV